MKKIDFKKNKNILSKFCQNLAERALLTFLTLVFISSIVGGFLFYQYGILAQKAEPEIAGKIIQFEEALYQKILAEWQNRQIWLEEADAKKYHDPFRSLTK